MFYSCSAALMSEMMCPAAENERMNMKYFCFCLVIKQQKSLSSSLSNVRHQKYLQNVWSSEEMGYFCSDWIRTDSFWTGCDHAFIIVLFPDVVSQEWASLDSMSRFSLFTSKHANQTTPSSRQQSWMCIMSHHAAPCPASCSLAPEPATVSTS